MPFDIVCPDCTKRLTLGDDRGGTVVWCPRCATAISIPACPATSPISVVYDPALHPPSPARRSQPSASPAHCHSADNMDCHDRDNDSLQSARRLRRSRRAKARLLGKLGFVAVLCIATIVAVRAAVSKVSAVRSASKGTPSGPATQAGDQKIVTSPPPAATSPARRVPPPSVQSPSVPPPSVQPSVPAEAPPVDLDKPAMPRTRASFVSDRPANESSIRGYFLRRPSGFEVYASKLAYEQSDELVGEPMKVIDDELARIVDIFDEKSLKVLRSVPIWIEWDHTIPRSPSAFGVYYGQTGHSLLLEGVDPRKANCICILSLKVAHKRRSENGARQNTLLHEFAHVIHDKIYGLNNPFIMNAYQQATARRLYNTVYAGTRHTEYFAEITCAYLERLDYTPHNRQELKEYDSVGYEMAMKAWGTPEQLAERKKNAASNRSSTIPDFKIISPMIK